MRYSWRCSQANYLHKMNSTICSSRRQMKLNNAFELAYLLLTTHWHGLLHSTSTSTPTSRTLWLLSLLNHRHHKVWHWTTRPHPRHQRLLKGKPSLTKHHNTYQHHKYRWVHVRHVNKKEDINLNYSQWIFICTSTTKNPTSNYIS